MIFNYFQKFPSYRQLDEMDCGTTCLRIIAKYHGRIFSKQFIDKKAYKGKSGVNLLNLSDSADIIGFRSMSIKCNYELLLKEQPDPFIAHWNGDHFIVVYKITKKKVYVSDPAKGLLVFTKDQFCKGWYNKDYDNEGIALIMNTTPDFYSIKGDQKEEKKLGFGYYLKYIIPHYRLIIQLAIALLLTSIFSLITPFLTQAMVDQGIQQSNIRFVYIVLIAQLMLFVGETAISLIQSWIMLHMSVRINISVLSDFLVKLMKLPIAFFDSKNLGDIMQRMEDHSRIEDFLTSKTLEIVFSLFNIIIYSFVMLHYSVGLFMISLIGTTIDFVYVLAFLKRRKKLDYLTFDQSASDQNATVSLIQGMQEIKLHTCEKEKRWNWERVQIKLFRLSIKTLILEQIQGTGASFINNAKNIAISIFAAKLVIDGDMTLGMMMAATQILGQLDGPISQFVNLAQDTQDAKISLERLGEVQNRKDEDHGLTNEAYDIPHGKDIVFDNVGFRYGDPSGEWVLKNFNLTIPYGKTTAIVGESGNGKTTLLKLLLRFYELEEGEMRLGNVDIKSYSTREWRKRCGVVMQNGYIFSDTIANNIALVDAVIDEKKLLNAVEIANAKGFIEALPKNYNTRIGDEGKELSAGQKQRILIARAVYKNPEYIFLDEASSALDAKNEREITNKIEKFNKSRTAVIIAHRLSTVRAADNIIVLQKGIVAEQGTHDELVLKKGVYYELVEDQLQLS